MWSRWKLLNEIYDTCSVHVGQNTSYLDISSQLSLYQSSHWRFIRYYRSSNSKHCSSNRNLEFEHFSEIISISVISKKIYLTSLKLQHKPGVIKMKITQCNIWHIFRPRWTKHFIFGHFIAIVAKTVISFKIYEKNGSSNSNYFSWLEDLEFKHFSEIISILVISEKIYLISLELKHKPRVIKMKIIQLNIWHIFRPRWTKHFIFGHFITIVAKTVFSFKIYEKNGSSNSNHCSSKRNFEFEHFSEMISMSVISKNIYLISLELQQKPRVIKMKIIQLNIWHIFSPRWTKHFIFGHFIAIVAITVISLKIYKILQKL